MKYNVQLYRDDIQRCGNAKGSRFEKDFVELWRQILLSGKESSVNWHRDPVHERGPGAQEEENTLDDIINLRKP